MAEDSWLRGSWEKTSSPKIPLGLLSDRMYIAQLTSRAEKQWNDMLNKQSRTLGQAYREYRRRYGRDPPRGFDAWYTWATERGLKLVDGMSILRTYGRD